MFLMHLFLGVLTVEITVHSLCMSFKDTHMVDRIKFGQHLHVAKEQTKITFLVEYVTIFNSAVLRKEPETEI